MQSTQQTHMLYLAASSCVLVGLERHFLKNPKKGLGYTRLDFRGQDLSAAGGLDVLKNALQAERVKDLKIIFAKDAGFSCILDVLNQKPLRLLIAFDLENTLKLELDAYIWDYFCLSKQRDALSVFCTGVPKRLIYPLLNLCESISVRLSSLKLETACNAGLLPQGQSDLALSLALGGCYWDTKILELLSPGRRLSSLLKMYQGKVIVFMACVLAFVVCFNSLLHRYISHLKMDTAKLAASVESLQLLENDYVYNALKIDTLEKDIANGLKLAQYQQYWPCVLNSLQLVLNEIGHTWLEELEAFYNEDYGAVQLHLKGSTLFALKKPSGLEIQRLRDDESFMNSMVNLLQQSPICNKILNTKMYSKNENENNFEIDLLLQQP
jgi:hypothetical protein